MMASDRVGWAWIVCISSSIVDSSLIETQASWIRSVACGPIMWTPRISPYLASVTILTKPDVLVDRHRLAQRLEGELAHFDVQTLASRASCSVRPVAGDLGLRVDAVREWPASPSFRPGGPSRWSAATSPFAGRDMRQSTRIRAVEGLIVRGDVPDGEDMRDIGMQIVVGGHGACRRTSRPPLSKSEAVNECAAARPRPGSCRTATRRPRSSRSHTSAFLPGTSTATTFVPVMNGDARLRQNILLQLARESRRRRAAAWRGMNSKMVTSDPRPRYV